MDNICRSDIDQSYPISVHIDVNKFSNNHTEGKANRCQAIDDALDSMFYVFKRAALNHSQPLDFSIIQFYPNASDPSAYYNLTDLINTSWIKSETILEHVCNITDSVKRFVQARMAAPSSNSTGAAGSSSSSTAQKRNEQQPRAGVFTTIFDLIDRLLDPILGLQKRLMWESNNRLEMVQNRLSSGLGTIRDGFGTRIKSTRDRLSHMFTASSPPPQAAQLNSTKLTQDNSSTASNSSLFSSASSTSVAPAVTGLTAAASKLGAQQSTTMAPVAANRVGGFSSAINVNNANKPTAALLTNNLN